MTHSAEAILRTALGLARRGLNVFPCAPAGKEPLTKRGCLDASQDAAKIAIATGRRSGVFVVDVDGDEGESSLRQLEAELGALPASVEVITGRGRHLYYRLPVGAEIRNSASRLGLGLDIRGEGGYVLAPPSLHPSGRRYCWSVDSAGAFAEPPAWLIERLASRGDGAVAPTAPESWREIISSGAAEGARNATLARLAGLLFRRLDPLIAADLLVCWNALRCRPPLPEDELRRTLDSIAARELRRIGGAS